MSGKVIAAAIGIAVGAFFAFWLQYRIRQANHRHGYGQPPPLLPPPPPPTPQHPPVARSSKRTRTRKLPKKELHECVICLESLLNDVKTLPCGHTFHPNCIQRWLNESEECPYRCNIKKAIKVR